MEPLDKQIIPGEQVAAAERWQLPEMDDPDARPKGSNALGYQPDWYNTDEAETESSDVEEEQPPLTLEEIESIRQAAYDDGFAEGKEAGYQAGFDEGRVKGEEAGHAEGLENGRSEGLELGRSWIEERSQQWQELLDKLLGDGAAALALASLAKIVDGRAQNGRGVHAHVSVEGIVFCGQKGHGQIARYLFEADDIALFMKKRAQGRAVTGQNNRGLRLLVLCYAVNVRKVARGPVKEHDHAASAKEAANKYNANQPESDFFP